MGMLYVLMGPDLFERQRRMRDLVGSASVVRQTAYNGLTAMMENIGQADLFGSTSTLVLEGIFDLSADEQGRLAAQLVVAVPSEQIVIVLFSEVQLPVKSALTLVLQQGRVENFELPPSGAMVRWLLTEGERLGVVIDKAAAPEMAAQFGGNKFGLITELQRLRWHEPATVTTATLAQLWPVGAEAAIFGVVDAWAQRNAASTLQQLRQLWRQQTAPQLLLSLFERQARLLYLVLQAEAAGVPVSSWPGQLGIQPFMTTKLKRWSSKWSLGRLQKSLKELVELDQESKSGGGTLDFGLERWVVQSLM
jgi:DNA polymerase III delta subunit